MTKKKNPPYKVGDNCYFMSKYMTKPKLGLIKKVMKTEEGLIYRIVDVVDQKFNIVEHNDCGDNAKVLKSSKKATMKKIIKK